MKEISIEEKAKRYDDLLVKLQKAKTDDNVCDDRYCCVIDIIVPELKESEDERIRKEILSFIKNQEGQTLPFNVWEKWIAWLEKQGEPTDINPSEFDLRLNKLLKQFETLPKEELASSLSFYLNVIQNDGTYKEEKQGKQKPCMIRWKGDNLKELIDFTGKDKNFEKWFKSFEEYEKYVGEHNGIFKLFNEDGSHYEVPVGAWIVKTPDGYNVASKAVLKQNPWSEEDEKHRHWILEMLKAGEIKTPEFADHFIAAFSWLKSIRPQNRWKPSEEQMDFLQLAIEDSEHNKEYSKQRILTELMEDLKNL